MSRNYFASRDVVDEAKAAVGDDNNDAGDDDDDDGCGGGDDDGDAAAAEEAPGCSCSMACATKGSCGPQPAH